MIFRAESELLPLQNYDYSGGYTLNLLVNIGGTWKDANEAFVNIGGTWKAVEAAFVNIGGTWRELG